MRALANDAKDEEAKQAMLRLRGTMISWLCVLNNGQRARRNQRKRPAKASDGQHRSRAKGGRSGQSHTIHTTGLGNPANASQCQGRGELSVLIPVLKNGSLVQEKLDNAKAAIDDWVKLLQERGAGRHP
jgi:hypothetical protein